MKDWLFTNIFFLLANSRYMQIYTHANTHSDVLEMIVFHASVGLYNYETPFFLLEKKTLYKLLLSFCVLAKQWPSLNTSATYIHTGV